MPDISMCHGTNEDHDEDCPMKDTCYRYMATPNPHWQSYFMVAPFVKVHDSVTCEDYWKLHENR